MNKRGRTTFALTYLAPAVVLYAVFVLWPLVNSFALSLFQTRGLSDKKTFVGVANYQQLATDENFHKAIGNNLKLLAGLILVILTVGLLLAHISEVKGVAGKVLRSVYLFPHLISIVIVGILWNFLLHPTKGLITGVLDAAGWKDQPIWLQDQPLTMVGVAFIWYSIGFYVMLLAAGLKGIPADVTEAAELDGAHGWKRFRLITWPMIWSVRRVVVIHTVISVLNTFALVRLMTNGGPDRASEVTLTYLYEMGFQPNSFFGLATSIAVVNLLVVMLVAGLVMLIFRRDPQAVRR